MLRCLLTNWIKPDVSDWSLNSVHCKVLFGVLWWIWASLVAQRLKHLPGMQETRVRSLGQEDPLKKEMATHSSTLTWKIPRMEEPGRLQSMGLQRVGHDWATSPTYSYDLLMFVPFIQNVEQHIKEPWILNHLIPLQYLVWKCYYHL